jgi:hypothetical protein
VRTADGWEDVPGWRFFRNVLRAGLYMRERRGLAQGDRVVVLSPMRVEQLAVEWACVVQGAVLARLSPTAADETLTAALTRLAPKLVFAAGPVECARLLRLCGGVRIQDVVAFEGKGEAGGTFVPWSQMMDLAGTLDTAERAQSFRKAVRAVGGEMPAIVQAPLDGDGPWSTTTHAQLVGRLIDFWSRFPARQGDVAYVVDPGDRAGLRLALWSFIGDGKTTAALGTAMREADEVAGLRPAVVAAPPDALERIRRSATRDAPSAAMGRVRPAALAWIAKRIWPGTNEARRPPPIFSTLEGDLAR